MHGLEINGSSRRFGVSDVCVPKHDMLATKNLHLLAVVARKAISIHWPILFPSGNRFFRVDVVAAVAASRREPPWLRIKVTAWLSSSRPFSLTRVSRLRQKLPLDDLEGDVCARE